MLALKAVIFVSVYFLGAHFDYGLVECSAAAHSELVPESQSHDLRVQSMEKLTLCAP